MLLQSILKTTQILIYQILMNRSYMTTRKLTRFIESLSFDARQDYLEVCYPDYKKGSSRMVIPVSERHVLKIAYNEFGIEQNMIEYNICTTIPVYYRRFLAKIKKASADFSWVLQERVTPCNSYDLRYSQEKLVEMLQYKYDLCDGDLDQTGILGKRTVIYDYGYTHELSSKY